MTEETHQTRVRQVGRGMWLYTCPECSFEATELPELGRFEIHICGNPFARHICHRLQFEVSVRDLIEELDLDLETIEVEY